MRILWVMNKQLDAASDRAYISTMAGFMKSISVDMTILARYKKVKMNYNADIIYLPTLNTPILKLISYYILLAWKLLPLCRSNRPDFVVIDRPYIVIPIIPTLILRMFFKDLRKIKFVLDVRSLPISLGNFPIGSLAKLFFDLNLWISGRLFDGHMAITPAMSSYVSKVACVEIGRIGIWSSAYDSGLFFCEDDLIEVQSSPKTPLVIYHGAVEENRMLIEMLEAIKLVRVPCSLMVLGNGTLLSKLKVIVDELGLANKVTFVPPVPYNEVPRYLKAAVVGVVPIKDSLWFNTSMPIKLLEYLAVGLYVVAPDTEPVRNVTKGVVLDIYSFNPNHNVVLSIASAIETAVKKSEYSFPSKRNSQHVKDNYTWESQCKRIKDYLTGI